MNSKRFIIPIIGMMSGTSMDGINVAYVLTDGKVLKKKIFDILLLP
ncbi:hypothetical protein OBA40_07405 [Alphaproteobacteria bacterium]|nr:hypothetical protein [Alphaproteobacteria bacterium]